jgi:TRAP-type C4-dicarboxylate transport system permease small subunit
VSAGTSIGEGPGPAPRPSVLRLAWDHLEEALLCVLLVVMVVITFVTVVTRYVFEAPLSYVDQLVPNLFVWVTFLGASAAVRRRAHLGLSAIYDLFPARGRVVLDAVILAGTSGFFLATAWFGGQVVRLQVENQLMNTLGYPAWMVGIAVPAGALLFVVRAVEAWWNHRRGHDLAPTTPPIA